MTLIPAGPTHFWKLDEPSASTTYADVGAVGGKALTDHAGSSVRFDTGLPAGITHGTNFTGGNFASIATPLTQVYHRHFSAGGWFQYVSNAGGTNPLFCASYLTGHNDPYYTFAIMTGSPMTFDFDTTGVYASNQKNTGYNPTNIGGGNWHHLMFVYDPPNLWAYLDGVQNNLANTLTANVGLMGSFAIGDIPALGSGFSPNFYAAMFGYWANYAITSTEIAALYAAGSTNYYALASTIGAKSGYADEVLHDSPVAYLKLDEPSGTTVADSTGNGLTGTIGGSGSSLNNASYPGADGKAWSDNASAYIDIGANSLIDITGDFTYECWIKLAALGDQFMMNKFYEGHEAPGFVINSATHTLRIMQVAAGTTILLGSTVLSTGVWYHVACTRAGNVWTIYLNGISDGTVTTSISMTNDTHKFRIGAYYSNSFAVQGLIDEVAIYNHAVSATRIMAHYAAHSSYNQVILNDGPTAYWPLEDTEGTVARDVSGNANHGTITGDTILKQTTHIDTLAGGVLFNSVTTTGFVSVPAVLGFATATSPKSYEAWFKTADLDGPLILAWSGSDLMALTLGLNVSAANGGTGHIGLSTQDSGSVGYTTAANNSINYADSAWHHVVLVRSGHVWSCYVDGNATPKFTVTDVFTSGITTATTNKIGNSLTTYVSGDRGMLTGTMQAVAVYDVALTTAQIAAHYAAAVAVTGTAYTDAATTPFVTTYSGFEGNRYTEAATISFKATPSDTQTYGRQDAASIRFVTSVTVGETSSFRPRGSWGSFDDDDGIIP